MTNEKLERLRARAEAALGNGDLNNFIDSATVTDYKSALAEMSIYQAELLAQHEDLEEANTRVNRTAHKLSELLDLMDDPYFILSHQLQILDSNRAADRVFQLEKKPAFNGFPDLFASSDRALVKVWLEDRQGHRPTIDVKGESEPGKHFRLTKHLFNDDTVLVIVKDITELAEQTSISESLRHALQRVEQLQKERETAFAYLAHEMRTPASTIAMLLEADDALRETESGRLIKTNIKQVLSVMDDLKVVVRPDAEIFKEMSEVDLSVLVGDTLASLSDLFEARSIATHLSISDEFAPTVRTNIQSVKQIVTNLLKNAALHSAAADVWVNVSTLKVNSTTSIVIKVSDNGKGVLDSDKKRIFLPFERGEGTAEGTGIGLDVCKRLAKQLRGNVTLSDRPGGGSEFVFTFYERRGANEVSNRTDGGSDAQPLQGLSVLFVDDDVVIRKLSAKILTNLGADVKVAGDGEEGLKRARTHEFSLIVTDIMMPNIDGIEMTRILRAHGFEGVIVGCSAATVGDELDNILAAGADAVLPKPLSSKGLTTVLASMKGRL